MLSCPVEMQYGCIDLIHNFMLTPLQNFKTCPEKSLLLIQPVYVKLQTQRFSTGAGSAGTVPFIFPHKIQFWNDSRRIVQVNQWDRDEILPKFPYGVYHKKSDSVLGNAQLFLLWGFVQSLTCCVL